MTSSAKEIENEIKLVSERTEISQVIMNYNRELVIKKFELYGLDFQELEEEEVSKHVYVTKKKKVKSFLNCNSCNQREIFPAVENIYKKKLLAELNNKRKELLMRKLK